MYIVKDAKGRLLPVMQESPELHETMLALRAMLLETETRPEYTIPLSEAEETLRALIHAV